MIGALTIWNDKGQPTQWPKDKKENDKDGNATTVNIVRRNGESLCVTIGAGNGAGNSERGEEEQRRVC